MKSEVMSIAITELTDFTCRRGDLILASMPAVTQMQGMIAHSRLQAARKREDGYQAEVTVDLPLELHGNRVRLRGRMDGVWLKQARLEEIKTVGIDTDRLPQQTRELHWAQAMCYGFCLCRQHDLADVELQLTYVNTSGRIVESQTRQLTQTELTHFVEPLIATFVEWQRYREQHRQMRNAFLASIQWPFAVFRDTQRTLAETVYKAIHQHSDLLVEAPTGTGKTMAHLFPALKALAQSRTQRLVWLTAKTSGQHAVLGALGILAKDSQPTSDNPVRALQLTARDKICFCRDATSDCGSPCSYTLGYYDKLPRARKAACEAGALDTARVRELARRFEVCPFQLGLDLIGEMDITIGDFNYVFDPLTTLTTLSGESAKNTTLLIDEAHNLIERSHAMYSATISIRDILDFGAQLKTVSRSAGNKISRLLKKLKAPDDRVATSAFETIAAVLRLMMDEYGSAAAQVELPQSVVDAVRPILRAMVIAELAGEQHRLLLTGNDGDTTWNIANLDPAPRNHDTLAQYQSSILFSGTLNPLAYSRRQLGLADGAPVMQLGAPFAIENLHISLCTHIDTRFRQRDASQQQLAQLIDAIVHLRRGNYLCAFPSYQYLEQIRQLLAPAADINVIAQSPQWRDEDRDAVIAQLRNGTTPTLVLTTTGGSFGESIDLPGDSLIGVIIIGVGLQAPDVVSEARRDYFDAHGADGYALSFQYPGWQRVVQTAGRLIRSEQDRGVLVLVDPRYARADYRRLRPAHWRVSNASSNDQCIGQLAQFWRHHSYGG
jgi:Rad3-related DNA helicase